MATAGMPSSLAYAHKSFRRVTPSSSEYSVCTCRWTKLPASRQVVGMGPAPSLAALMASNPGISASAIEAYLPTVSCAAKTSSARR